MELNEWERTLIRYYLNTYNAKWMQVYQNKHPFLATKVFFYNIFKKRISKQPYCMELTFTNMYKNLTTGEWYYIPHLLRN